MMPRKTSKTQRQRNSSSLSQKNNLPKALSERAKNDRLLASQNYFSYLSSILRATQLYNLFSQYLSVFRRFRLVSLLFRIYSYLLVLLQLGTAFVVIVIGILILLPVLLLSAISIIFSALVLYRKQNTHMEKELENKRILVFFPTRDGELETDGLWKAHIRELATQKNTAILIVSPFFWSGKGLCGNRFYFLLRKENSNIYLLRKHYYFSLKRKIFENKRDFIALIY